MNQPDPEQQTGIVNDALEYVAQAIDKTDEQAAAQRVAELRKARPGATIEELVEILVKQKAMRTGAVGAVTSGAAVIPGLGTLSAFTFGVAADIGMTFKMQAELVLEIAAIYQHPLSSTEKRNAVLLVTGVSAGANQVLSRTGTRIAQKTSERLAEKAVIKAIPVLGVAASAGTNILSTYVIGQRANAYFGLGPEAVGDWAASARAVSGIDERKLIAWLAESTEHSWTLLQKQAHDAAGATIVVGKSAGKLIVKGSGVAARATANLGQRTGAGIAAGAGRAGEAAKGASRGVIAKTGAAAGAVVGLGKRTAEGVAAGADKAAEAAGGAHRGIARRSRTAAEAVRDAGKKTRAGVAARANRAGEAVKGAGRGVARGTGAAAGAVGDLGKRSAERTAARAARAGERVGGARRGIVEKAKTLRGAGKKARADEAGETSRDARPGRAGVARTRLAKARNVFRRDRAKVEEYEREVQESSHEEKKGKEQK